MQIRTAQNDPKGHIGTCDSIAKASGDQKLLSAPMRFVAIKTVEQQDI